MLLHIRFSIGERGVWGVLSYIKRGLHLHGEQSSVP
jgi:hypothetical protein